jgi:hypothetical protein
MGQVQAGREPTVILGTMSSGSHQPIPGLEELLSECVVFLDSGEQQGTGFVIGRDLLLTCRHVIDRGPDSTGDVTVRDSRNRSFQATVLGSYPDLALPRGYPDLAVLRINSPEFGYDLPAVILDDSPVRNGEVLTVGGYPANTQVGYQTRYFTAAGSTNFDAERNPYLRVLEDQIAPGMSGSPVLNEVGLVCGYVRLQIVDGGVLGGFVIPLGAVRDLDPELKAAYAEPGPAAAQWARTLSALDLKSRGRDVQGALFERAELPEMLDIAVTRTAMQPMMSWTVATIADASCQEIVTEVQLGSGVFDAVHHWSGRHPVRTKADVTTLGDLLSRALFPPQIIDRVTLTITRAKRPLIRLRVGQAEDLGEIRWEYANLPGAAGAPGRPLATQTNLAMSRYVDVESSEHREPQDKLRVLLVVAVPSASNFGRGARHNATSDRLGKTLHAMLGKRARFEVTFLCLPTFSAFQEAVDGGSWDLVHFIGYATQDLTGMGFAGGYDYADGDGLIGTPVANVAEVLQNGRVQCLIMQLFRDDPSHEVAFAASEISVELLGGPLRAVVVAEHPLDLTHVMVLNENFYEALRTGESVEVAVQLSRKAFSNTPPGGDFAAFGGISVTTSRDGHVQLLKRLPDRAPGTRSSLVPPANDSAKVNEDRDTGGLR